MLPPPPHSGLGSCWDHPCAAFLLQRQVGRASVSSGQARGQPGVCKL